jgi:riboflavin transporter FmnP
MNQKSNRLSVRRISLIGILSAAAYLVMLLKNVPPLSLPLFSAAPFLNLDIKDVIIAVAGLVLGPLSGVLISVIVSFVEMITNSGTGWIGFIMNVLSTCAFILPAALLYRKNRKLLSIILGLAAGIALMVIMMLAWNWIVTPIYMGVPRAAVEAMLLPVFLPFNLIKGLLNAVLTVLLYKPLSAALRGAGLQS